jgi:hypothetical protein
MSYYLKDPQSRVDYAIDWADGYLDGQAIAASQWAVSPAEAGGIEVDEASFDLGRTAATLTGGVSGHIYRVSNRVTMTDGRYDERSILLRVEPR